MSKPPAAGPADWRFPRRVAYVVNHSLPYSSDGYAVRSHEVARALSEQGHEVLVINRPGRPWDIEGFDPSTRVASSQVIDGIRYLFLPSRALPETGLRPRLRLAERVLMEVFEVFRPGAVIGVSNWENAEPAMNAARRWGAPFFYEQRGFWEMSSAASDPDQAASDDYRRAQENDARIAQSARAVFTLNPQMKAELAARGVPESRIHVVANGVRMPGRIPRGPSRADLGIRARHLLGYVGSLAAYEGSEDLPDMLARLRAAGTDADLLVVGSSAPKGLVGGADTAPPEAFARAVERHGMSDHIHFTGQIPYAAVGSYYTLLDAMVMTRRRSAVAEMVTPMKPYAAAAYGLPVFLPDMAPLDTVASDIHASLYPPGDMEALAGLLRETLEKGGHPAVMNALRPAVQWTRRVLPMARQLRSATDDIPDPSRIFAPAAETGPLAETAEAQPGGRFDRSILPQVALRRETGTTTIAALGPCRELADSARLIRLTRTSILGALATRDVGRFVIDWAGLQDDPGEWAGLWSIDNMRLNRLVMDACAIAQDRGWQLQVNGPVSRSRAPLFRTVSSLLEEIRLADSPAEGSAA